MFDAVGSYFEGGRIADLLSAFNSPELKKHGAQLAGKLSWEVLKDLYKTLKTLVKARFPACDPEEIEHNPTDEGARKAVADAIGADVKDHADIQEAARKLEEALAPIEAQLRERGVSISGVLAGVSVDIGDMKVRRGAIKIDGVRAGRNVNIGKIET